MTNLNNYKLLCILTNIYCFAACLPVDINFFSIFASFSVKFKEKGEKGFKNKKKQIFMVSIEEEAKTPKSQF